MSEEVVPDSSNAIKIQPRNLPGKKRKKKKVVPKPSAEDPAVKPKAQPAFESNVERTQFLLQRKRKRKKSFFKNFDVFHPKPEDASEITKLLPEEREEEVLPDNSDGGTKPQNRGGLPFIKIAVKFLQRKRIWLPGLGVAVLIALFSSIFYQQGFLAGTRHAKKTAKKENAVLTAKVAADINGVLEEMRFGDSKKALVRMMEIENSNPRLASISYLTGLAALQSGDFKLAERKAEDSITKGERISDALGIKAVVQLQKASDRIGVHVANPRIDAEGIIRQAILTDVANPYPHFELANLLRSLGRKEEAMQEIKSAQMRLNPMDSQLVMGVTMDMMAVEAMREDQLKPLVEPTDDVNKLFPAALAAMRMGDFSTAAEYLRTCRNRLPGEVFSYLVNDPALRQFVHEPQLAEFYVN